MLIKGLIKKRWPVLALLALALLAAIVYFEVLPSYLPGSESATEEVSVPGYTEAPYLYPDEPEMLEIAQGVLAFMDQHFLDDDNREAMGYIQYGDLFLMQARGMCKQTGEVEIWVLAFRYEDGTWTAENIVVATTMAEFMAHYERFETMIKEAE